MLLPGIAIAAREQERQANQIEGMTVKPHLAIIQVGNDSASDAFVKVKQRYGEAIGVKVTLHKLDSKDLNAKLAQLNNDDTVHGIIVQLPLPAELNADEVLNQIEPAKDVDGLGADSQYASATPAAILGLLKEHQIDLADRKIAILGQGRLVGKPLAQILQDQGHQPTVFDEHSPNIAAELPKYNVIITATGQPGLLTSQMVAAGTVIVDAGTSRVDGRLVGDVDPELYERGDIQVSPVPGGVGPLTVCALFANLLQAASVHKAV